MRSAKWSLQSEAFGPQHATRGVPRSPLFPIGQEGTLESVFLEPLENRTDTVDADVSPSFTIFQTTEYFLHWSLYA